MAHFWYALALTCNSYEHRNTVTNGAPVPTARTVANGNHLALLTHRDMFKKTNLFGQRLRVAYSWRPVAYLEEVWLSRRWDWRGRSQASSFLSWDFLSMSQGVLLIGNECLKGGVGEGRGVSLLLGNGGTTQAGSPLG